ncbi:MAG: protease complex subunit PrcB family protein [Elusimicrobiota bacterium]|nr:MAG: protease complex subunit PrcB family protein [Elusimicrobiota bacterium]
MAARSPRLFLLAAAVALAACERAPVEPAPTPELSAPEPSSSLVTTPLDAAATGYTNEMQAEAMLQESADLGIEQITRRGEDSRKTPPEPALILTAEEKKQRDADRKERLARAKRLRLEYTRLRRNMEGEDKSVAILGSTVAVISGRESGGLVGVAEDSPGVWSGAYGGAVDGGDRVVENKEAWSELWSRLSREPAPPVSFETHRVAAVFAGSRPTAGYRARLVAISREKDRWVVRWLEEGPAADETPADGETAPFLLAAVPRDEMPVRFEKIRRPIGPKRK